jgi:acid phosphatase type 7
LKLASAAVCLGRVARAATTSIGRSPYLQRLLSDRVSILWTTPQPSAGTVTVLGSDGSTTTVSAVMKPYMPSQTAMSSAFYQYQADVTGLQPGTSYSYRVSLNGQMVASNPTQFSFTTPTPGKCSFLTFGDSGANSPQQLALIQLMMAEPGIGKVIHVGDLAYFAGTFGEFETNYFTPNAPLMSRLPFFATPGNHEYLTDNAAPFLASHVAAVCGVPSQDTGRYYSFDWGDAHFVSIDSNLLPDPDASVRMLAWLDADLAATGKYWKIVFLHHPPYPTGFHLGDPICVLVQQNVNPIVENRGVHLVLAGHEHGYERSWPLLGGQQVYSGPSTTYIITGGGGGIMEPLGSLPQCALSIQAFHYLRVDMSGNQLSVTATGMDGNAIDQFSLAPPPVLSANGVVSVGDLSPSVASGSLASIFGQNLALRPAVASSFPLSNQLGGISVSANGVPVPVLYASPSQLNVQIPYEVSGQVNLQIDTPNGSSLASIQVVPLAPSIIAVAVQNALCTPANPAQQSGNVIIYATGLGAATSPLATGEAATAASPMAAPVLVWLGTIALRPTYAGLAPGLAGVSQVNFVIPASLQDGVYFLRVAAGTASSQPQSLSVGAPDTTQNSRLTPVNLNGITASR